jgi:hypothetical protein
MHKEDIQHLHNPLSDFPEEIMDQHFLKALRMFILTTNASEATYNGVWAASQACYLDDPFLSFDQVKCKLEMLTGVVPIMHNMCINMCAAFTGPFMPLDASPKCSKSRYHPGTRKPQWQFLTIPISPVLQALYCSEETTEQMHNLECITDSV